MRIEAPLGVFIPRVFSYCTVFIQPSACTLICCGPVLITAAASVRIIQRESAAQPGQCSAIIHQLVGLSRICTPSSALQRLQHLHVRHTFILLIRKPICDRLLPCVVCGFLLFHGVPIDLTCRASSPFVSLWKPSRRQRHHNNRSRTRSGSSFCPSRHQSSYDCWRMPRERMNAGRQCGMPAI